MRTRLTLLLLLGVLAWGGLARADHEDQNHDAAVARADAGFTPAASPPLDTSGTVHGHDAAVLRVISSYGRAIETQNVGLFRSVMPDMGRDAETRLRRAFQSIGSQQVRMTVESMDVDGATATVRVLREDTVDGHRMKLIDQSFHLVHLDGGWRIQSLSFRR